MDNVASEQNEGSDDRPSGPDSLGHETVETTPVGTVTDGFPHKLSENYIPAEIALSWIMAAVIGLILLVLSILAWWLVWLAGTYLMVTIVAAWVGFALLAWVGFRYPYWEYRVTEYIVTEHQVVIHSGILWKNVTTLPRTRIQHIDVSQGPLARRYGLGNLILYTAGTEHNQISLQGIDYDDAVLIRDFLVDESRGVEQ